MFGNKNWETQASSVVYTSGHNSDIDMYIPNEMTNKINPQIFFEFRVFFEKISS